MNLDLNNLLKDWPHEPGQIKVRKVMGRDGDEKIQLRLDLGLLQMELRGRPDGQRPKGCESLLNWHQQRARAATRQGKSYLLSPDDCGELQAEGVQYYHRYLSLFQIDDYDGVVRDTQRNLDLFAFVRDHTSRDELAWAFEQFVPYVTMMNARAKAALALIKGRIDAALREIDRGRERIVEFYREHDQAEMVDRSNEISFLDEWREELRAKRPVSKLERLQREMQRAIDAEAYEQAAALRDQIRVINEKTAAARNRRRRARRAASSQSPSGPGADRSARNGFRGRRAWRDPAGWPVVRLRR